MVVRILTIALATFWVLAMFGCGHQYNPERDKDCRGCGLTSVDLSGANLGGADLHRADLTDANLSKANLTDGHRLGTNLKSVLGADFRGLKTLTLNI